MNESKIPHMIFRTKKEATAFLAAMDVGPDVTIGPDVIVFPTTHRYWTITSRQAVEEPPKICAICGNKFREYPNNPLPVTEGQCCAYCDESVVWPARSAMSHSY